MTTDTAPGELQIGPATFAWGRRTYVMGIVNVTPDSFSGDGLLASSDPVAAAVVVSSDASEREVRYARAALGYPDDAPPPVPPAGGDDQEEEGAEQDPAQLTAPAAAAAGPRSRSR